MSSTGPNLFNNSQLGDILRTLKEAHFPTKDWSTLGLALGLYEHDTLSNIRTNYPRDNEACLREMLTKWLQRVDGVDDKGGATQTALVNAVETIDRSAASNLFLHTEQSQGGLRQRRGHIQKHEIVMESKEACDLETLDSQFASLVAKIRGKLADMVEDRKLRVVVFARHLEEKLKVGGLTELYSVDEIFHHIRGRYYYLNCSVIEFIVNEFIAEKWTCMKYITGWFQPMSDADKLQKDLAMYIKKLRTFEETTTLKELRSAISNVLSNQRNPNSTSTCTIELKLHNHWNDTTIANLKKLLKHYFQSSDYFNHISIIKLGSVCITFLVPLSRVQYILDAVTENTSTSMHRVGIFELIINGKPILSETESINFEHSLLKASFDGNIFEVSILLDLGIDPTNCHDSNGKTPLMLAIERGHTHVQELLLSAGAGTEEDDPLPTVSHHNEPSTTEEQFIEGFKKLLKEKDIEIEDYHSSLKEMKESINKLKKQLETQYTISRKKGMENEDLKVIIRMKDNQLREAKDLLKELKETIHIKEMKNKSLREQSKIDHEKTTRMLTEKDEKIDILLIQQSSLRDRKEPVSELKRQLETQYRIRKVGLENKKLKATIRMKDEEMKIIRELKENIYYLRKQLESKREETTGSVDWYSWSVDLYSPSPQKCQEVISKLEDTHKRIELWYSSPDIVLLLLPSIVKRQTVKVLAIFNTPLTLNCIQSLSLSSNTSLQQIVLTNCSITDDVVSVLCHDLHHNTTLMKLDLSCNTKITSSSALFQLLVNNVTLTHLSLHQTSLSSDAVLSLMDTLTTTNTTLERLVLDTKHEDTCKACTHYELIKDRLFF